jgi:hypothetical protein
MGVRTFSTVVFAATLAAGCFAPDGGAIDDGGAGGGSPSDDLRAPTGGRAHDMAVHPGGGHPDLAMHGSSPDLAPAPQPRTTVFTILLENHDYAEVVGSSDAPYLNSLIAQYGLATNYQDSGTHPSLPNYLYLISGDTQGISSDVLPTSSGFPVVADNLGSQFQTAHVPWRSYQESMTSACKLSNSGNYAPRHDPFLYFDGIQNGAGGLCAHTNVDYSNFAADLASGAYRYMWITPNLIDDGHNPTTDPVAGLQACDAWLGREVPKILASSIYKEGGILFITWDEAEGRNGDPPDQVPMIVVTQRIPRPGYTSAAAYDHASYLATVEDLFGLPRIGAAVGAATLAEFFP